MDIQNTLYILGPRRNNKSRCPLKRSPAGPDRGQRARPGAVSHRTPIFTNNRRGTGAGAIFHAGTFLPVSEREHAHSGVGHFLHRVGPGAQPNSRRVDRTDSGAKINGSPRRTGKRNAKGESDESRNKCAVKCWVRTAKLMPDKVVSSRECPYLPSRQ